MEGEGRSKRGERGGRERKEKKDRERKGGGQRKGRRDRRNRKEREGRKEGGECECGTALPAREKQRMESINRLAYACVRACVRVSPSWLFLGAVYEFLAPWKQKHRP